MKLSLTILLLSTTIMSQNIGVPFVPYGNYVPYGTYVPPVVSPVPLPPVSNAETQASIIEACGIMFPAQPNSTVICAADGELYSSVERAKCVSSSNTTISGCDSARIASCAKTCKSKYFDKCRKNCRELNINQICASDGEVYNTACEMNCKNPENTKLFTCDIFDSKCDNRCEIAVKVPSKACTDKCTAEAKLQCGNDGNLYTSRCYAKCVSSFLSIVSQCRDGENTDDCRARCQNLSS